MVSFPAADVYSKKATPAAIGKLIEEYSDRLQGMGKMPTQIKLHINQTVKPIHQKMRRVPLHVRAEVEKELDRLEQLDIIERASGPTPWVSLIVVVHKTQGVRICIDSRAINTAIEREKHPIPTLDEVIADMNGADTFSKIDLNKGYPQLELHSSLRGITTFTTHKGLYRYKRLCFALESTVRQKFSKKGVKRSFRTSQMTLLCTQREKTIWIP